MYEEKIEAGSSVRRASGATYGSLAYDLNRTAAIPAEFPEEIPEAHEKARYEENKQGISLFALVGFAVVGVLLVTLLTACIRMTAISKETVALQKQLSELKEENAKLQIAYESSIDYNQIEEYATNVLGMTKVSQNQMVYLQNNAENKAVILNENMDDASLWSTVKNAFLSFMEYFK